MFGMPTEMFAVFAATIIAGSLGAIHYVVVHVILKRPFGDEDTRIEHQGPAARAASTRGEAAQEGTHAN